MLANVLRAASIVHLVLAALLAVIVMTPPGTERYGDRIQIALPLLAWGCAATNGDGRELFTRFAIMFATMHTSKIALGDAPINQRPNGGTKGFPSGHTAAATFGASALVHDCIAGSPVARTVIIFAAAFVGASRIAVDKHDIWQVFAGGALGVGADRALRRDTATRRRILRVARASQARLAAINSVALALLWSWLRTPLRYRRIAASLLLAVLCLGPVSQPSKVVADVELSLYGAYPTAPHSTIGHSTLGDDFVQRQGKSVDLPPQYGLRATW